MNVRYIAWTTAMVMAASFPRISLAEEFGDVGKGRDFAERMCADCHAVGPERTTSPKPGVPSFKAVADKLSTTRTSLTVWFRSPHPTMPNLVLAPEDLDDVIAYILSLKSQP